MASIIDEFKEYLNTPRKIILFRFGISLVFFLVGLSMVTRVSLPPHENPFASTSDHRGRSLRLEYRRSISGRFSVADYRRGRVILHRLGVR